MNATVVLQKFAGWVLWNSSGAAVLVLLILIVRLTAGRALSARLRSRLWLLVVVRLMIPLLPAVALPGRLVSRASTFMPQRYESKSIVVVSPVLPHAKPAVVHVDESTAGKFIPVEDGMTMLPASPPTPTAPILLSVAGDVPIVSDVTPIAKVHRTPIDWRKILLLTWLAGTAVLLGRLVITTIRLARFTRQLDPITDPILIELLESSCALFGVRRVPQLLDSDGSAPALVGYVRPRILLPASLASHLSLDEIRLIFLHELAHLKRRDVLLNYLFAMLSALHWFNPLLWIASHRMAADRELACDDAVLRVTSRRQARLYGCTLLKLVELLNFQRLPAGAVGVVQNKTLIQRRIDMIASYPSRTARSSKFVRSIAVSLTLAAAVSTIRAQETPAAAPTTPAAPAAPSAVPVPASAPPSAGAPAVSPAATPAPDAVPAAGSAPAAPSEPSVGPVGLAPPAPSAPPIVDATAPSPTSANALPNSFTADEIATVSPHVSMLDQNVQQARLSVEALEVQGLKSNSKPMKVAQESLAIREKELRDYVADWNRKYQLAVRADGTPFAMRKQSELPTPAVGEPPIAPSPGSVNALPRGLYQGGASMPQLILPPGVAGSGPGTPPAGGFGGGAAVGMGGSAGIGAAGGGGGPVPMGGAAIGGFGGMRADAGATRSIEDAATRQANIDVMQKLAKSHNADFHGMVLRDALSYIADGSGVDVVIDERSVSQAGVDVNAEPVTLHVGSKPMEQILSLTLRLASPRLEYSIYNGVVFISSREALNRRVVTRIYDVPGKLDRDGMVQMITSAVDAARCNFFGDKIVITAPEVAQRDIARLLSQVEPVQTPPAKGALFLYQLRNAKAAEVAGKFPKELGEAAVDDRTNSLLITTTDINLAKQFVGVLDKSTKLEDAFAARDQTRQRLSATKKYQVELAQRLLVLKSQQELDRSNKELASKIEEAEHAQKQVDDTLEELKKVDAETTFEAAVAGTTRR